MAKKKPNLLERALAGNVKAMYTLGQKIYDECNSTWHQPDEVFLEAFKWLQKAADGGEMRAYTTLGYMYASGKGVESNPMKALNCFKKAADAGDDNAAFMVGFMKKQIK